MSKPQVQLDLAESFLATQIAAWRCHRALSLGFGNGHGESGVYLAQRDVPGALGELAVAKYLNIFWAGGG